MGANLKKLVVWLMALYVLADDSRFSLSYGFEKEVLADRLVSFVELSFFRDSIVEAKSVAGVVDIGELAGICTGGGVAISPEYSYSKGKTKLIGHTSTVSLRCEFDLNNVDLFSKSVERLHSKVNENLGRFSMSAPTMVLSKNLKNRVLAELEDEAIVFAQTRSNAIRDRFGFKRCVVAQINFRHSDPALFIKQREYKDAPLETKEKIVSVADITIDCK